MTTMFFNPQNRCSVSDTRSSDANVGEKEKGPRYWMIWMIYPIGSVVLVYMLT